MDPFAPQACACRMTLGIRPIGGHHQLFSPDQSTVKASTASEPEFQHRLLKVAPGYCGNQQTCQLYAAPMHYQVRRTLRGSTASHQLRLLKRGTWLLWKLANLSTVCGPHALSSSENTKEGVQLPVIIINYIYTAEIISSLIKTPTSRIMADETPTASSPPLLAHGSKTCAPPLISPEQLVFSDHMITARQRQVLNLQQRARAQCRTPIP